MNNTMYTITIRTNETILSTGSVSSCDDSPRMIWEYGNILLNPKIWQPNPAILRQTAIPTGTAKLRILIER